MSTYSHQAHSVMASLNSDLATPFKTIIGYLDYNRDSVQKIKGLEFGTHDYLTLAAYKYIESRKPKAPKPPATVPDPLVGVIISSYFDVSERDIDSATNLHSLCMGAENLVGDILERYISEQIEPHGWAWCSGSLVKAVDFVHDDGNGNWRALQIKNRDNSENSSSSAIRKGTTIEKWFRTFSKKPGDNWGAFPIKGGPIMDEISFQKFVKSYLTRLKSQL